MDTVNQSILTLCHTNSMDVQDCFTCWQCGVFYFGGVKDKSAGNCTLLCKVAAWVAANWDYSSPEMHCTMWICPLYHKPDFLSCNNDSESTSIGNKISFGQRDQEFQISFIFRSHLMSLQIGPRRPADNHYNPHKLGEQPIVPEQNQNVVKEWVFLTQNCTLRLIALFSSFGLPPF